MKDTIKILLFLALCAFATGARGQIYVDSYRFAVASGLDADAQAFLTAAGITDNTITQAINTLVLDLKSYGIWSKMLAVYPFVGGTASTHKWNLKDPRDLNAAFRLTFTGGWTHSSTGALPNGTTGYANTFVTPSLHMQLNSSSLGYYSRTNNLSGTAIEMGSEIANNIARIYTILAFSNKSYIAVNSNSDTEIATAANTLGFSINSRTNSSSIFNLFNTTLKQFTVNSNALSSQSIYLGAYNRNGTATNYSNKEVSFAFIGNGITTTEASNFYTAVQAFQTTLGRQVDLDAQAFISAASITNQTQIDAVNNLVIGLKNNNLWNKMIAVYPFVGGTATAHSYNLKNPSQFQITWFGTVTHNSSGAQGNGSTGFGNTNINAATNLSSNNAHASVFGSNITARQQFEIGAIGSDPDRIVIHTRWTDNRFYADIPDLTTRISYVHNNTSGYFVSSRSSSNLFKAYINGSVVGTNTGTPTETLPSRNIYIMASNYGGNTVGYSTVLFKFATFGEGLSDVEVTALNTLVSNFNTSLSR